MNNLAADQLDQNINALLAGEKLSHDLPFAELIAVAEGLRRQPRPAFRLQLAAELRDHASRQRMNLASVSPASFADRNLPPSPADRGARFESPRFQSLATPPLDRAHLAVSFALHVAALAGLFTSGLWMVEHRHDMGRQLVSVLADSPYILAPSRSEAHGGGGGGSHDKLPASKGTAPRFAHDQLTPPEVVVPNESPRLPAEPTLVGPPDLKFPISPQTGDPMANILSPSNGSGSGGGIGSGSGGGVGSGYGPGLGPGFGGGVGGGIYRIGGGVSAPRATYSPDPEYSEEARKAKFQGTVTLQVIIGADGRPRDLHVIHSLGMGLDEKALEAVRHWRFEPASKDGHPVSVMVAIEVAFRLY